jgi:FtsP/CotA-like multicopper oxidase with cupredoxin domain
MIDAHVSRRDVLKFSALGAAALTLPIERVVRAKSASRLAASKLPQPYTRPFVIPKEGVKVAGADDAADYYIVKQELVRAQILDDPTLKTNVFAYNGQVPGPTIHARQGRQVVVRHVNNLPATHPTQGYTPWTSTHLHGSASLPQFDGYASDITNPGEFKDYLYPNVQDARTLWYHDHGVHHTAENAYMGLAAQYLLHDEVEDRLPIPKGRYDCPLILADKMFGTDGNFMYDDAGHSGLWGDVILVNGVPWPKMQVEPRKYRFRVLNASISRGYRLQLADGTPMTVIATDGGLMPRPQTTAQLRIGMAERYEIVIDFAKYKGRSIELLNLGVPNSINYDNTGKIMRFDVGTTVTDPTNNAVSDASGNLNPNPATMGLTEKDATGPDGKVRTTRLEVVRTNGMWQIRSTDAAGRTLNKTWEEIIASNYTDVVSNPAAGEVQVWEIKNSSGGWFHPVHIHLVDFKMLTRNGAAVFPYEQGPKDVMYVGENETIRAVMRFGEKFEKFPNHQTSGRYMVHCHNLPHEDHDMMTQFQVGANTELNDPCPVNPADPTGGSNPARKGDGDPAKYKLRVPTIPGPRIGDPDPA